MEFEVEDIVSITKTKEEGLKFQVKWKGYDKLDWVPEVDLHCPELVKTIYGVTFTG